MRPILEQCLAGEISPQVALSRLLLGGFDAARITQAVADLPVGGDARTARRQALVALLDGRAPMLDRLTREIAASHGANQAALAERGGVAGIAAFFDRAVAHLPEAGVALYSLGDPLVLAAATAEIVVWLAGRAMLGPECDVLDLGCGFGRIAEALVPGCRSVLGVDVSAGMIAEARRRFAGDPRMRFETTPGRDLDWAPARAFDLVLAVDSFPYLVQAGVAEAHVAGAARTLRPGGALVILNLSYGRAPARDITDAQGWAERHGFDLAVRDRRPFTIWDGTAFVLRLPA